MEKIDIAKLSNSSSLFMNWFDPSGVKLSF